MIHDKLTIYLGGMIIGYGLITPVHLDGHPVAVVTGADLLVCEPDVETGKYNTYFYNDVSGSHYGITFGIWNG